MAKRSRPNPADFTVTELKSMLAAKSQIDELEAQRDKLVIELDKVEKALAKLLAGSATSRKPARKKAAKKSVRKRASKKALKKVGKKAVKKASTTKSRPTIESVIVDLLTQKGEPMAFKDILAEIQKRKLVKTKATDFSNVLRRTVSTSKVIKRVGRGVYGV